MTKLNQILAIEKGERQRLEKSLGDFHKKTQKNELYEGRMGTYRPHEEDGDRQPDKTQMVQQTGEDALTECAGLMSRLYDLIGTKDKTNTKTSAEVLVDGHLIMSDVPVSYLLYMEKQLNDMETFVRKLPTLPTDKKWVFDANVGHWVTEPTVTFTTKKVPRTHVKYEATKEHPAQTEMYMEDVQVGTWTTVLSHGGLPIQRKNDVLERIAKLKNAVKMARETANAVTVVDAKVGEAFFGYIFGK
jgi:hypothetical protein